MKDLLDHAFRIGERILINASPFADFYTNYYHHMISDEISMAGISSEAVILHIGCGAVPNTAITLARDTGARVTALDNDSAVVKKAAEYVKNHGLNNLITVKLGDGTTYPTHNFDFIIISLGVEPITKVFDNLRVTANPDTKIIYRRTRWTKKSLFIPDCFRMRKKIKHHMFLILSFTEAVLLSKDDSSEKIK